MHECKHNCDEGGICLAEQSGYPTSCPRPRREFNKWFAGHHQNADGKYDHLPRWLKEDLWQAWIAGRSVMPAEGELDVLKRRLKRAEEWRDQFDCCMCGSRMEEHNIGSGHSPISMYDYHLDQLQGQRADLLAALVECLREHGGFTISGECERMARAAIAKAEGRTIAGQDR